MLLLAIVVAIDLAHAQILPERPPSGQQPTPLPLGFLEEAAQNRLAPCLEPVPLPSLKDYQGPMSKVLGSLASALERTSVHQPHYKAGLPLCALGAHDKFLLFVKDSTDPLTFLSAGFDAATDQASDRDHLFGQGGSGYAARLGADLADRVSSKFFREFAYPVIFSEDPRYYRLGRGGPSKRIVHAASHLVLAHHADGTRMFNYSGWLGAATSVALSSLYHPGQQRGAAAMARRMGDGFASNIGFDLFREFWPDIARKFKLPLRGTPQPALPQSGRSRP